MISIISTLKTLGIPVALLKYTGNSTSYVVYQTYLEKGESYSEDEEDTTGHYILMNLFTKGDNTDLIASIKALMLSAGFTRQNEHDLWEDDTLLYNHIFNFYYDEAL